MKSTLKRLALTLILCVFAQASFAHYEVRSHIESITNGPNGDPCTTVLTQLWEVYTNDAGTTIERLIGSTTYKMGDCGELIGRPDCNDPIPVESGLMVTNAISPMCASEMLAIPGVYDMVVAAIDSAMSGIALRQTGIGTTTNKPSAFALTMYPNPASMFIMVSLELPGKNGALLSIYDANGKQVRSRRFSSQVTKDHFIMDVSSLPRGSYSAVLKGTDGLSVRTPFVLQ